MRRLICAFVVRKPPKTGFVTTRPISLIPNLGGVIYDGIIYSKTPFKVLAERVLIHIRFNIVNRKYFIWQIAQTLMRHRILVKAICKCSFFKIICINALTTSPQLRTLNFRQTTLLTLISIKFERDGFDVPFDDVVLTTTLVMEKTVKRWLHVERVAKITLHTVLDQLKLHSL